jgi:hypothetical protein
MNGKKLTLGPNDAIASFGPELRRFRSAPFVTSSNQPKKMTK